MYEHDKFFLECVHVHLNQCVAISGHVHTIVCECACVCKIPTVAQSYSGMHHWVHAEGGPSWTGLA